MPQQRHAPPFWLNLATYFAYGFLILIGKIRDFFNKIFKGTNIPRKGYAPLLLDFEDFFTRRIYHRIHDGWNRPIKSCPGAWIDVIERVTHDEYRTLELTDKSKKCLNLGSYNYLGFGDPNSPTKDTVLAALDKFGVATNSTRLCIGTTTLHDEAEKLIARFMKKPAAMIFGMGFGTNGTGIPSLVGKGCLIISDAMNHASIAFGSRSSGAVVKVFKHNDPDHLDHVIRTSIIEGQPRTHRPWKKILIVIEGIYSMEGETCPLAEIVKVKKKYNCFLYIDEAHSIGALGQTGRGICEHTGVDTSDVDILMGTFTKSFGSVGGYISGSQELINYLRQNCPGSVYSASISPPAVQQIISAIKLIMGEDGTDIGKKKILALRENANFFRKRLIEMGCHVLGDWDSPIIPVMIYNPAKIIALSRDCLNRGVAIVVVGFPASALLLARARICISAAHTREDLEYALKQFDEASTHVHIKYGKKLMG